MARLASGMVSAVPCSCEPGRPTPRRSSDTIAKSCVRSLNCNASGRGIRIAGRPSATRAEYCRRKLISVLARSAILKSTRISKSSLSILYTIAAGQVVFPSKVSLKKYTLEVIPVSSLLIFCTSAVVTDTSSPSEPPSLSIFVRYLPGPNKKRWPPGQTQSRLPVQSTDVPFKN